MKTCNLILAFTALACILTAAEPINAPVNPTPQTAAGEEENELDVSADRMEILLDGKTIELTDNVRFEDDAMILTASRMMIYLQDDAPKETSAKEKAEESSNMKLKRIEAFGNVVLRKKIDASDSVMGDKAIYEVKTDTVALTGNCIVSQGGHTMRGKAVTFDRLKQKINVKQAVVTIKIPKSKKKGSGLDGFLNTKEK